MVPVFVQGKIEQVIQRRPDSEIFIGHDLPKHLMMFFLSQNPDCPANPYFQ
jgi:hypothetical protein